MVKPIHLVNVLASPMPGSEAMSLQSSRAFSRHSHDHIGIGVISQGAQRSWSVLGQLDAGPGDVIIVNPGEIHDGVPLDGIRHWQMVYIEPELLWKELRTDDYRADSVLKPQIHDKQLSRFQLLRSFPRDLGITPHAYLLQL